MPDELERAGFRQTEISPEATGTVENPKKIGLSLRFWAADNRLPSRQRQNKNPRLRLPPGLCKNLCPIWTSQSFGCYIFFPVRGFLGPYGTANLSGTACL
jgi:hypothetical protein